MELEKLRVVRGKVLIRHAFHLMRRAVMNIDLFFGTCRIQKKYMKRIIIFKIVDAMVNMDLKGLGARDVRIPRISRMN